MLSRPICTRSEGYSPCNNALRVSRPGLLHPFSLSLFVFYRIQTVFSCKLHQLVKAGAAHVHKERVGQVLRVLQFQSQFACFLVHSVSPGESDEMIPLIPFEFSVPPVAEVNVFSYEEFPPRAVQGFHILLMMNPGLYSVLYLIESVSHTLIYQIISVSLGFQRRFLQNSCQIVDPACHQTNRNRFSHVPSLPHSHFTDLISPLSDSASR